MESTSLGLFYNFYVRLCTVLVSVLFLVRVLPCCRSARYLEECRVTNEVPF